MATVVVAALVMALAVAVSRERSSDGARSSQRYYLRHSAMTLMAATTAAVKYAFQGGSNSFVTQLNGGEVSSVLVNTTAQTIQVTLTDKSAYTISYPDATLLSQIWPSIRRSRSQPRAVARRGAACFSTS